MPQLVLHGLSVTYETLGDGFPLLLLPGAEGTATGWEQYVPLLSELCRAITYTVAARPPQDMALLQALVDCLQLERLYLACQAPAWPLALQYTRKHAARLEGLLFVGTEASALPPEDVAHVELSSPSVHRITVPALVLLAEQSPHRLPQAEVLSAALSRSRCVLLSPAESAALPSAHAMLRFLVDCERQRNLVRGASFLL